MIVLDKVKKQINHWLIQPAESCNLVKYVIISSIVILAGIMIYYLLAWDSVYDFVNKIDHCELLFCDFVLHFYKMAESIFVTGQPVPGYFYSPFFAFLLAPFAAVSLDSSMVLWGIFQILSAIGLCLIPGLLFIRKSKLLYYLQVILFFTAYPLLHNFKWGQVSVFVTLCVIACLFLYRHDKKLFAVICLALGAAIKYYTGLFIIFFLFKKDYKFVATFIVLLLLFLIAIPALLIGIDNTYNFYPAVYKGMVGALNWMRNDVNSQYFPKVFCRLTDSSDSESCRSIFRIVGFVILVINLAFVYLLVRKNRPDNIIRSFILLFLSIPFAVSTSWPHYFVFLSFCQVFLFMDIFDGWKQTRSKVIVSAVLIGLSAVLSNIFLFNIIDDRVIYCKYGSLFFSNTLLLVALYIQNIPQVFSRDRSQAEDAGISD